MGGARGARAIPPLPLFWVKKKEESQKEEKPAGQTTKKPPPPPHPLSSRSGSATEMVKSIQL